jgi:hypothetical protein
MGRTTVSKTEIQKILEAGIRAPSGDNLQPWRFKVMGHEVKVFYKWSKNDPLYDFEERGAMLGHGALIENMLIAAGTLGYRAEFTLFPDNNDTNHVSTFNFIKAEKKIDPLSEYIFKRTTNRKRYDATKLTPQEKEGLVAAARAVSVNGRLVFVDDPIAKRALSNALGVSERMIFENHFVHSSVYTFFRWSKKDIGVGDGLDVKTLEFNSITIFMLRLLHSWPLTLLLKPLGIGARIARKTADRTNSSGAICAIVTQGETPSEYIESGRAFQRIWLEATRMGLSVHPIVASTFLGQRVRGSEAEMFTEKEKEVIDAAFSEIEQGFDAKDKNITMVFRIGRAETPLAHTLRRTPEIIEV